jgi:hypothetical protein
VRGRPCSRCTRTACDSGRRTADGDVVDVDIDDVDDPFLDPELVALSSDGHAFAYGDLDELVVADVSGRRTGISVDRALAGLALGRRPGMVIGLTDDGVVHRWDRTGRRRDAFPTGLTDASALVLSPDETALAVFADGSMQVYALDGTLHTVEESGPRAGAGAFAPDGTWLVTADRDAKVRIRGLDGAVRGVLDGYAWDVAVSPDGKLLATVDGDDLVQVWDLATLRRVAVLRIGGEANTVSWFPIGIVVGGEAGVYVLELHGYDGGHLHSQP